MDHWPGRISTVYVHCNACEALMKGHAGLELMIGHCENSMHSFHWIETGCTSLCTDLLASFHMPGSFLQLLAQATHNQPVFCINLSNHKPLSIEGIELFKNIGC